MPLTGLWLHADFRRLWAGRTISYFGDAVTDRALPLTAVLTLNAGEHEMGYLGAAERLPFLVVSLAAGVVIDRVRRRPVLLVADVSRALLLASIPVAWAFGALRQQIAPSHMAGRVNANVGFLLWAATPIGSLAGGFLGAAIGLRMSILFAGIGILLATLWTLRPELT